MRANPIYGVNILLIINLGCKYIIFTFSFILFSMPKNLITIALLAFYYTASSQELHLDLQHKKLRDFVLIQQNAGNKPISLYSSYMVASGIAQPVAYVTHQDSVPDMVCYCFYRTTDSTITSLEY